MTTQAQARAQTWRHHELLFDTSDAGHDARCSCKWPRKGRPFLEQSDAHYAGAEHLGRMAYLRLALRGLVSLEVPPASRMWLDLLDHRSELDGEANAVLDVVAEHWPERMKIRGGGRC